MRAFLTTLFSATLVLASGPCRAGVTQDLQNLRNRCLYFAAGRAPNDANTVTLLRGLYKQSPWPTPAGQIDIAASGFSLAALPAAVECGVIASNAARAIATNAAARVLELVTKSAAASNTAQYGAYGYLGMLYHYYVWSDVAGEFQRQADDPSVEVSSVDTALLLWGLHVCAHYFGEPVMTNYAQARGRVAWSNWLDRTTPAHSNQFWMSYTTNTGLTGHWDWRSDETALVCILAAMSDTNLDTRLVWNAWTRTHVTYTSPGPTSQIFRCLASWNGDPFTDFQALAFLDTSRFPPDFNDVDWFENNAISYRGHMEFFAKERGFRDGMTYSFFNDGPNDAMAEPKSNPGAALTKTVGLVHSIAGGLPFLSPVPASNELALTLSYLVTNNPSDFFAWHGWPKPYVNATNTAHEAGPDWIIGQNIALTALAIDNYLTNRTQNIALRDPALQRVLNILHPPRAESIDLAGAGMLRTQWHGVPFSPLQAQSAPAPDGLWTNLATVVLDSSGLAVTNLPASPAAGFLRLSE